MDRLTKRVHGLADISDAMLPDLDWEDYLAKIMERLCAYEEAEDFPTRCNDESEVRNGMPDIEIYWNDLTAKKQQEILNVLGENGNYDIFPIATISYEPDLGSMDEPQM